MNENPFSEENKEDNIQDENTIEEENKEPEIQDEAVQENKEDKETSQDENDDEKYNELNNKYIRLAADFDNFRKRTQAEKEELSNFAKGEVIKKIISALDTFDRAREHLKEIEDCKTVKDGYEVAYKQLLDILTKIGLVEIEAVGKEFNPNEHEAVVQIPTDEFEPDTVANVMQKGYKLGDKVLRPALVGVAKPKE